MSQLSSYTIRYLRVPLSRPALSFWLRVVVGPVSAKADEDKSVLGILSILSRRPDNVELVSRQDSWVFGNGNYQGTLLFYIYMFYHNSHLHAYFLAE